MYFFTLTEVGLDILGILKSTNLDLKVSLFDKILERDICCAFPCKLSFCDVSDVTNVEPELVLNIVLFLMDFDSFQTITVIICKYVLGEMVSGWNV